MSTTKKSVPVAEHSSTTTRRCTEPGCVTPLSLYNTGDKCWHHQSKLRRAVIGMSAGRNPLPVWSPRLLFPPPKPRAVAMVPVVSVVITPPVEIGYTPPGKRMLEVVCKYFKLSEKEMVGPRRGRTLSHARQVLMYLLTKDLRLSSVSVGKIVAREHATVLHGVDRIDYLLKTDVQLQMDIATIRAQYQKPPS